MSYPSRHERGYGYQWVKARELAMRRDEYLCVKCRAQGRTAIAKDVDHITPKAQGGTDDQDNLQSLCTECHKAKTQAENSKTIIPAGEDGWPVVPATFPDAAMGREALDHLEDLDDPWSGR